MLSRTLSQTLVCLVALLLVVSAQPAVAQTNSTTADLPDGGAIATVNDIEMYYETHGEGDPVLLIHSVTGSTAQFDAVIPALTEEYQVIALDFRGHGRTSDSGLPLTYAQMADDVIALMDTLDIDTAHVVGNKDGGIIGLIMALNNPERIARLVVASANYTADGLQPWFREYVATVTYADWDAMTGEVYATIAPDPAIEPTMLEKVRNLLLTQPNLSLAELQSIAAPVLILAGADEEVLSPGQTERLAAAIPDSQLVLIPDAGHGVLDEQTDQWISAVSAFLADELDAPPAGKYAAVDDIQMYYEIHGEGEPVLLIHSVTGSTAQFANVIPVLAEDYQVIALDFRGHGRTTDAGKPLSYAQMALDTLALMDTLDLEAAHIVGNKDGGIIGLAMAQEAPARVKSLVAASANWSPQGFQPWFTDYVNSVTLEDWDAMTGEMYRTVAPDPAIMPVMLEKVRNLLLMQPNFTEDQLASVATPVLVLAGADEEVLDLAHVEAMAAMLPNAELVLIEEAGHGVLDEQTDAWISAVQEFLAGVVAQGETVPRR